MCPFSVFKKQQKQYLLEFYIMNVNYFSHNICICVYTSLNSKPNAKKAPSSRLIWCYSWAMLDCAVLRTSYTFIPTTHRNTLNKYFKMMITSKVIVFWRAIATESEHTIFCLFTSKKRSASQHTFLYSLQCLLENCLQTIYNFSFFVHLN